MEKDNEILEKNEQISDVSNENTSEKKVKLSIKN